MLTSVPRAEGGSFREVYERLYAACARREFAGWDPFDGLESRLFKFLPLRRSRIARLIWLQGLKRSPIELRGWLSVPIGVNPKAVSLFALAEMSRWRTTNVVDHLDNAESLLSTLIDLSMPVSLADGTSARAFGYNFAWQSRHFFAPNGTPSIVPTAFASQAFFAASDVLSGSRFSEAVLDIANLAAGGLNRPVDAADEVCFSYTPLDNSVIYNASLLAAESLARGCFIKQDPQWRDLAIKALRFVARRQAANGSWRYGDADERIDSFHTAYVLLSLHRVRRLLKIEEFDDVFRRGVEFWIENFFIEDGTPKYFDTSVYPIDIHAAAVAIAAAAELSETDSRLLAVAETTAGWTVDHMLGHDGLFFYQVRRRRTVRTPFMRWGQAWMAYALAMLLEAQAR